MISVTLNTTLLDKLAQELAIGQGMYVKVGVLGDYAPRTPDEIGTKRSHNSLNEQAAHFLGKKYNPDITNPEVGLIHEFGSVEENVPERSFIRIPLMMKLPDEFKGVDWVKAIIQNGMFITLDIIGNGAVGIIAGAFGSNGYGRWRPWSERYARFRASIGRSGRILTLSGQLARSITYAVVRQGSPKSAIMRLP